MYSDDDMFMLSGIQHFKFCPRQWALIHLEQQWEDNRLTIEGQLLHKHVDDPFYRQKCGEHVTLRSVQIASHELGLYGISDAIELLPSENPTAYVSITSTRTRTDAWKCLVWKPHTTWTALLLYRYYIGANRKCYRNLASFAPLDSL